MKTTSDELLRHSLFYSQIAFAMNASRIMKSLILLRGDRPINSTEIQVISSLQMSLIINSVKIWDRNSYSIYNFFDNKNILETERTNLKQALEAIEKNHKDIIVALKAWRNQVIAHLDKFMDNSKFIKLETELALIQRMLQDVANLVERASWFPANYPFKFLNYSDIRRDLRL